MKERERKTLRVGAEMEFIFFFYPEWAGAQMGLAPARLLLHQASISEALRRLGRRG